MNYQRIPRNPWQSFAIRKMCDKLLANPVTVDYLIEVEG